MDKPFRIEKYTELDQEILRYLFSERKMDEDLAGDLPSIGFLAFDEDMPVAAGFLRRIEGGYSLLDGLISNPNCSPGDRHNCIDMVVQALINVANTLGHGKIWAFSLDNGTLRRSLTHGFKFFPHTVIGLNLEGEHVSNTSHV